MRELPRSLEGAVRDERDLGAARREVRCCELADASGTDEQHATRRQVAEDLGCEGGCSRRHGRGTLADRRLGADALPDTKRLTEDPVEHRAGSHGLVSVAYLAED